MRTDGQLTNMAGEFLTVGKLYKRGYQASVTLGNAKSVDVLVYNPKTNKNYCVQVKALRGKNCFPIKKENIIPNHIYVFIMLNNFDEEEDYYLLLGEEILADVDKFFGTSYKGAIPSAVTAILYGPLKPYKNNWEVFDK